jgi:hypothetical protein
MSTQALAALLDAVAHGRFPPADGTLTVVPAPAPYRGAVVAFTAHTVIAVDIPPEEVRAHLSTDDLGAPMAPPFLAWLGHQLGMQPGLVDVVLVHRGQLNSSVPVIPAQCRESHPRVARALHQRQCVTGRQPGHAGAGAGCYWAGQPGRCARVGKRRPPLWPRADAGRWPVGDKKPRTRQLQSLGEIQRPIK